MSISVRAELAFLNPEWRDRDDTPRIYSRSSRLKNTTKREVDIHDARPLHEAGQLHLDRNGFIVVDHVTAFGDFDDKCEIKRRYYPEMNELAKKMTGADAVITFPFHQVRSRSPANFFDAYSLYVHCDFSDRHWVKLAQTTIEESGCEETYPEDRWDYALYNLWRPIENEVQRDPLVLIDQSTVDASDLVDYRLSKSGETTMASLPTFSERYRFYFVSKLRPDEVLIFKQHDTRFPGPQVCPHTSFVDPTSPEGAPERQSIEVRMICLYKKP